jgi:hypothetical protein
MAWTGPRVPMLAGLLLGGTGLLAIAVTGSQTPYLVLVVPMIVASTPGHTRHDLVRSVVAERGDQLGLVHR